MPDIRRRDDKLKELIVYVAAKAADDSSMGAMKLNKVLFHAEVRAFLRLGQPISGHPYIKRRLGPAPKGLLPIRRWLEEHDAIERRTENIGAPHPQERLVALREPDTSLFTDEELAIVDEVIEELRPLSGTAVSEDSHRLPGWRAVAMDTPIPYETALVSVDGTDEEHAHARELATAARA